MRKNPLTEGKIRQVLDWAYDKSVDGIPGFSSVQELGESYLSKSPSREVAVSSLIRWQNSKAFTSGFVTGLGGIITLPVAIPANIASVILVQMRMIGTIAYIGGYDLKDDKVQTFVYICLCGNEAKDILKGVGVTLGKKITETTIKRISGGVIKNTNQRVGFRLLTKFGEKGVINLGKVIPVVGGAIGGTMDGITTNKIGKVAKQMFIHS